MRLFDWPNFLVAAKGEARGCAKLSVAKNQPKTLIPQNKNQIFQIFFNCLGGIELRESRTDIRGLFSYQKCR